MLTFVVPLTPKVPDLGLAAPFLYPLQAAGQVRVVLPALPLDQVDEYIRLEVHYGQAAHWQVFFLMHQDDVISSPLDGSLTAALWQIHRQVLQPLARHRLRPLKVWIGVLDEMHRQTEALLEPSKPLAWERWRLDATGVVASESFPGLFTRQEAASLEEAWHELLTEQNQNNAVDLAERHQEMRQENQARLEVLQRRAKEIITAKQQASRDAVPTPDPPFGDQEILAQILREYSTFLADCGQPHARDTGCHAAQEFPRIIARHLSLRVFLPDVVIIFFRDAAAQHFQRLLLQVVYGIITLVALPDASLLPNGKIYRFRPEFDQEAWGRMLAEHKAVLQRARENVAHELAGPTAAVPVEPEDTACICQQVLERKKLPPIAFPWLRRPQDASVWVKWQQDTTETINQQTTLAARLLRDCQRELGQAVTIAEQQPGDDLQEMIERLQEKLKSTRLSLIQTEPAGVVPPGGSAVGEAQHRCVQEVINQRPHLGSLARVLLLAALLAASPQLLRAWHANGGDAYLLLGTFLILFLLLSSLAALLGLWQLHRQLADLLCQAVQAAETKLATILERFAHAKTYLQKFCLCRALQQTLQRTQDAAQDRDRRRRQSLYHYNRLQQHLSQIDTLANLMALTLPEASGTEHFSHDCRVDPTIPEEQNKIYSPTWKPVAIDPKIPLQIGAQQTTIDHNCLRGLANITFHDLTHTYLHPDGAYGSEDL